MITSKIEERINISFHHIAAVGIIIVIDRALGGWFVQSHVLLFRW